nr:MAG: hypothetical protein [Caudoviricetes sp.]
MDNRLYLNKKDLIKMLEVIEKFPEYENRNFRLEYSSCEFGQTVDMIIETIVNGIAGELRISIADVSDW